MHVCGVYYLGHAGSTATCVGRGFSGSRRMAVGGDCTASWATRGHDARVAPLLAALASVSHHCAPFRHLRTRSAYSTARAAPHLPPPPPPAYFIFLSFFATSCSCESRFTTAGAAGRRGRLPPGLNIVPLDLNQTLSAPLCAAALLPGRAPLPHGQARRRPRIYEGPSRRVQIPALLLLSRPLRVCVSMRAGGSEPLLNLLFLSDRALLLLLLFVRCHSTLQVRRRRPASRGKEKRRPEMK